MSVDPDAKLTDTANGTELTRTIARLRRLLVAACLIALLFAGATVTLMLGVFDKPEWIPIGQNGIRVLGDEFGFLQVHEWSIDRRDPTKLRVTVFKPSEDRIATLDGDWRWTKEGSDLIWDSKQLHVVDIHADLGRALVTDRALTFYTLPQLAKEMWKVYVEIREPIVTVSDAVFLPRVTRELKESEADLRTIGEFLMSVEDPVEARPRAFWEAIHISGVEVPRSTLQLALAAIGAPDILAKEATESEMLSDFRVGKIVTLALIAKQQYPSEDWWKTDTVLKVLELVR